MNTNKGIKLDKDKPRMDLLCFTALEGLADVLTFGSKKYAPHNWALGIDNSRIVSSLLRHLSAYQRGENLDPESGLPHVHHISCNAMFLASNYELRKHLDDRPTNPTTGQCTNPGSSISPEPTHGAKSTSSVTIDGVVYNWGTKKDSDVL